MTKHTPGQWPDNICSGDITYGRSGNFDGFYLADASHGIPTFGSVAATSPVTIRGQHVEVFNYPGQTEAIAKQIVHRWNTHLAMVEALQAAASILPRYAMKGDTTGDDEALDAVLETVTDALKRAEGASA